MDANSLMFLFAGIAISSALFALLIFFYPRLVERSAAPAQTETQRALLPLVYQSIDAANRTAERAVRDGHPPLSDDDKRAIANSAYLVLPEKIAGAGSAPIKEQVSAEQFAQMVNDAASDADTFFKKNSTHFDQQYEKWKQEHTETKKPAENIAIPRS